MRHHLPHRGLTLGARLLLALVLTVAGYAQSPFTPDVDDSVAREAAVAQARARQWLVAQQHPAGDWSGHPGITAACVLALLKSAPAAPAPDEAGAALTRARDYLREQVRADGTVPGPGGQDGDLYAASMTLIALAVQPRQPDRAAIHRLRAGLLRALQPAGPGYGSAGSDAQGFRYAQARYPDLSNTQWALEALAVSQGLASPADERQERAVRRAMAGAVAFIASCQVLDPAATPPNPAHGGFTYYSVADRAAATPHDHEVGRERLWGSLSYGGLKTLVYGQVPARDPRLLAAQAWAGQHFSVQENPGLGAGGYYYYLYLLATAHTLLGADLPPAHWRRPVLTALLSRQLGGGQWTNTNPLWLESDAALCTAYGLLALSLALDGPH